MSEMKQCLEMAQSEDFSEKLEKAKQLYCLLNDISFGDDTDCVKSKCILQRSL